jgi:hypothetical protein
MSLFTKLFEAVHSWRRRRGGTKSRTRKRSSLEMEQLDHRQLLAVNFTGVVATDFPVTTTPGVTYLNPTVNQTPIVPVNLQPFFTTSGIEIDNVALSYDSTTDILSVGVQGAPDGTVAGMDDIAADSDNNGNSGTVNPNITAPGGPAPTFMDPPDMGGTKTYGVTFDLTNSGTPDIIVGFPSVNPNTTPGAAKPFEVAAFSGAAPGVDPFSSTEIFPQFAGNYFLENDPNHPNFEFQIDHFSQLYQQMTGQALNVNTTFGVGATAFNNQDGGVSDESIPPQPVSPLSTFTVPVTPTPPPPPPPPSVSPTIYVNVHENNHINTAHPTAIRVTILGSSGFDPTTIIPSTVKLGDPATINTTGASPILNFESNVNHDEFPDETFVFDGLDVTLPSGITTAEIEGQTTNGTIFESQVKVFNRDYSYYSTPQINAQQKSWLAFDKKNGISTADGAVPPPPVIPKKAQQLAASAAIDDLYAPFAGEKVPIQVNPSLGTAQAASSMAAPATTVVSIPTKHGKATKATKATKISTASLSSSPTVSLSSSPTVSMSGFTLGGGA